MTDALLVGLAGCGSWGRNVLRDLRVLGCDVVVADPSPTARAQALDLGAGAAVEDLSSLPAVDALVVATPASTHAAVVREALAAGVPVLAEKPLTTDVASAEALADLGRGRLFVAHVWRYHPGVRALGELCRAGELGAVDQVRTVRANWTSPRTDVDPVWTLAPHDLSIGLALLGEIPPPRHARVERLGGEAVGLLAVLGERPALVLETSTRYADRRREVRVHGEDGVAVLDADRGTLEIARGRGATPRVERRDVPPGRALERELAAFVDFLHGGEPPPTTADEGVAVVRALSELRRMAGLDA